MSSLNGERQRIRGMAAIMAAAAIIASALVVSPAQAATPGSWSTAQPGASSGGCDGVRATVSLDSSGRLRLSAAADCQSALDSGQLGLSTSSADFTQGLEFVSRTDESITDNYTMVAGKQKVRNRTATVTTLTFDKGGQRLVVILRTSSSGIAFRYQLPAAATITDDATEFQLPTDTTVTTAPYSISHEDSWSTTTLGALGGGVYDFGTLLRRTNGVSVLLSESSPTGSFSGAALNKWGAGGFEIQLRTPSMSVPAGFRTPWRTASIGSLASVFESTLTEDVAPASQIADTSWIKPGVSAWSWLDGGEATQRDLAAQKAWVDYAASQGWPYVLVDGGWKGVTWIPELVSYASARGVDIFLWYIWSDLETPAQRDTQFTTVTGWGVKGLKIDFMESDEQPRYQWYDATLAQTAQYHLMVDFHGARLPQGVSRTWPHLLTSEAVRGGEFLGGSRSIAHVAAAPFTRGAIGATDYTPLGFQSAQPNSDGAELAQTVLYDTGLLFPSGTKAAFAARPAVEWWVRTLPVTWDETRLVSGDPVTGGVVARRNGDRWYLGALKVGGASTISYSTSFLGNGSWLAEIISDASDGSLSRTTQTITAGATLSIPTNVANGGHVIRFTKVATLPTGYVRVHVDSTDQAINVAFASTDNGAAVVQWPANNDANNRFIFQSVGGGYVSILAQHSGKAVVTQYAATSPGTPMIQYAYEAGTVRNDEWLAEDAGGGRFRLLNRESGLYLTMTGTAAAAPFTQQRFDGSDRQLFWTD